MSWVMDKFTREVQRATPGGKAGAGHLGLSQSDNLYDGGVGKCVPGFSTV
jgi:hypothetical protein